MFRQEDATEVEQVIVKTLKITKSQDYSKEYIEANIFAFSGDFN